MSERGQMVALIYALARRMGEDLGGINFAKGAFVCRVLKHPPTAHLSNPRGLSSDVL